MHKPPLFQWTRVALSVALLAALSACGGGSNSSGSVAPVTQPITVAVSDVSGTVLQPGESAGVSATVSNDASNQGVSWSVTCATAPCGAVSPAATASDEGALYTAPAARPPASLAVTITATSVTDASAKGSTSLTVAGGMAVTITTSSSGELPTETSIEYAATVVNDSANKGVTWTLSCATPPCGTVSPASTTSGAQMTYTAPLIPNGSVMDVTLVATAVSDATATSSTNVIVDGRRIDLSLSDTSAVNSVTLGPGDTSQFTASIFADPTNTGGVTWALTCGAQNCGALSSTTSASGAPITYTAPPGPIASDLTVTVTATSISRPDLQATGTVTVASLVISVTPDSALIPLKGSQLFTGNLQWAPQDGVLWSLTQNGVACGNACGSFSAAQTLSGAGVTYTAPSVMPPAATLSVVATSVFDSTKTTSAQVQLSQGTVMLVPNSLQLNRHKYILHARKKCSSGTGQAILTNTGTSALTISGITLGGTDPQAFAESTDCPSSLPAGASCAISVSFTCSGTTATSAGATVSIADNSADSPQLLTLTGYTQGSWANAAVRDALSMRGAVSTPRPTGSHVVGTRVLSLSDASYLDPYLNSATPRELMVRLWYPTASGKGCTRAAYVSPRVWESFGSLLGVALPQVSTHSCLNASVDAGTHPLVVLTHGFTGTYTDYTFLAEELASRGYIVASVNHTFEATVTELPGGRLEKSVYGSHLKRYARYDAGALTHAVAVRLKDLKFVLDQLTALNRTPRGPFDGRLDLDHVALAGHSLGGLTTLRALASEPRFKAGIVLDGALTPQPLRSVHQPVLSIVAGVAPTDPDECRMWNALRGPRVAVALPGVEHAALSDAAWLVGTAIRTGGTGPTRVVSSVRHNIVNFLDAAFMGKDPEQAVTVARAAFPGAQVAAGAKLTCRAR